MTEPSPSIAGVPSSPAPAAHRPANAEQNGLPTIRTALSATEIVVRLDQAARRGKLPGFHKSSEAGLFVISDFGTPFESIMAARAQSQVNGTELAFELRIKPTMPWLFAAMLVITVWPGVWLTHSMLQTYFPSWYTISFLLTCAWYLPLTVPFVPLGLLQAMRKSRTSARTEALDLIEKIRGLVGSAVAS